MKIAVITPYYKETLDVLRRCHDSVASQTLPCIHYMVADGFPRDEIDGWEGVVHIRAPHHGDYGDTPRVIGTVSAVSHGADGLLLLDADCWFEPGHVAHMVAEQAATGADIITCRRLLRRPDESVMGVDTESDGDHFNDANCYYFTRRVSSILSAYAFKDPKLGIVADRILWRNVKSHPAIRRHDTSAALVNYATLITQHYLERGEDPPPGAKVIMQDGPDNWSMHRYEDVKHLFGR